MTLRAILAGWAAAARQALARLSERERLLLLCLGVVFALFGVSELFDRSVRAETRLAEVQAEIDEARALQRARADERLIGGLTRALVKAEALSFRAETFAIARVRAQALAARAAAAAGIVGVRVTAAPEPIGEGRVRLQALTIQGAFDWASFLLLAQALAVAEQSLLVSEFNMDASAAPQFELVVLAPVSVAELAPSSSTRRADP